MQCTQPSSEPVRATCFFLYIATGLAQQRLPLAAEALTLLLDEDLCRQVLPAHLLLVHRRGRCVEQLLRAGEVAERDVAACSPVVSV
jgi:hypothetical protein